jgi:hypothetical protein
MDPDRRALLEHQLRMLRDAYTPDAKRLRDEILRELGR